MAVVEIFLALYILAALKKFLRSGGPAFLVSLRGWAPLQGTHSSSFTVHLELTLSPLT